MAYSGSPVTIAQLIRNGATRIAMTPTASATFNRISAPRRRALYSRSVRSGELLVARIQITAGAMSARDVMRVRHAPPLSTPASTAFLLVGSRENRVHAHAQETAKKANSSSRHPPIAQITAL